MLVDMGFPRERVTVALTRFANNIDQATNYLIEQMNSMEFPDILGEEGT